MRVVNISLDPKILDEDNPASIRVKAYGELVDEYTVIVPTPVDMTVKLSDKATVYGIGGGSKVIKLYRLYKKLVDLVKAEKCDVIASADMYYLGLIALLVAKRYHLGLEVNVLGIEKLSLLRKFIAMYVLKRASVVRALSHRIEQRLIEEFGVPKESIKVISIYVPVDTLGLDIRSLHGPELHKLEEQREAFKDQYGAYTNFLSVCRLVPVKHVERQIQALKQLIGDTPNVRLHIVGDGPTRGALESEVKEHDLSEYVIFHGRKTGHDLGVFYHECDCFMLTSDYEGWGMVIVEAATAGMPSIMSDVGCAGEFLTDGESGLVVPVGDVDALAAAMKRIATEPKLREELSYGTKTALRSLETFDEILSQYLENWNRALANRL